jgi:hypothetical protein
MRRGNQARTHAPRQAFRSPIGPPRSHGELSGGATSRVEELDLPSYWSVGVVA